MTSEFIERAQRDYNNEKSELDWDSYLAGYIAAVKRFGQQSVPNLDDAIRGLGDINT